MNHIAGRLGASVIAMTFVALSAASMVSSERWAASREDPGTPLQSTIESRHEDNRLIVDARSSPYSAIGKFRGTMVCTAAIVLHPRIIITAGHCITDRDGTTKRSTYSFRLGYQAGTDLGRFEATVWALGSDQSLKRQSAHHAANDWAILVLDRAPAAVRPLLLAHPSFEALNSGERPILMPSYSSDIAKADVLSADPNCSVKELVWDVFIHDCKASYGSSGAPLLIRHGSHYALVGIHTGSIFASDDQGRMIKYVGNRAISSFMFAKALLQLAEQLNREPVHGRDSPA